MRTLLFVCCLLSASGGYTRNPAAPGDTVVPNPKEYAVLFQQVAAEYRALCYQAFNIAALRLQQIPKRQFRKGRLAIVTDLDETILDNSYSDAQLIKDNKPFNVPDWKKWLSRSAATGVPGAVAFLQAAAAKGVTIFYISNRDTGDRMTTLANLQKLQLPNADTAHMLFARLNESSKEGRRQQVAAQYNIVLLMGDNLNDFMNIFEGKTIADRFAETDKMQEEWGKKFIVLPNASYGEWENAVYDYRHGLTPAEKEALRRAKLTAF
jgi:5'-nucleotidase (lipoprotein e(P4) family)